jgi:2-polyprenyl-3-methyl-5-hydroxy-6-metoxy-1,4-benzoquinol methylase
LSIALARKGLFVRGVDINICDLELARYRVEKEGLAQTDKVLLGQP